MVRVNTVVTIKTASTVVPMMKLSMTPGEQNPRAPPQAPHQAPHQAPPQAHPRAPLRAPPQALPQAPPRALLREEEGPTRAPTWAPTGSNKMTLSVPTKVLSPSRLSSLTRKRFKI